MKDVSRNDLLQSARGSASLSALQSLYEPAHFIGRVGELALAQALIHEATLGVGSVLMFAGESGIGKSRFLAECSRLNDTALPLSVQLTSGSTSSCSLLPQLGHSLRLPRRSNAALLSALVQDAIVERSSRRTVVLLIDDVDGAGPDDIAALEQLMRVVRGRRVAIIGCFGDRPLASSSLPPWVVRRLDAATCVRRLGPLGRAPMELLVRNLVKDAPRILSGEEVREIIDTAEGNPRFAIELVACAMQSLPVSELIPVSAHAVAAAAAEAMSKQAFDLLAECSVVGRTFRDTWMIEILQAPRSAVADALQAGADKGLLAEHADSPGWFTFRHEAVRRALSSRLISLKRQMLHERVSTCLNDLPLDVSQATFMAPHWDSLQNDELAAERLTRAARNLEAQAAFAPAAALYDRALAHVAHGNEAWRSLVRRLAHCYNRLGEWENLIPRLECLLPTLDSLNDAEGAGAIHNDLLTAHLYNGDRDAAQRVADDLGKVGTPEQHQRALCGLA